MKNVEIIEAYKQGNVEFFRQIHNTHLFNCILDNACVCGNLDLLKFLVEHFQVDLDYVLNGACYNGKMDIVQFAIEKGATNFNIGLSQACWGGHIEIVKLMIQKGANDWNNGLRTSTINGHTLLSKLMIDKGATDLITGLHNACLRGNLQIVEIIFEKGVNYTIKDLKSCLQLAYWSGSDEVFKLIIRTCVINWKKALEWACLNADFDFVRARIQCGVMTISYEGCIEVIKLMIEYGANIKSCKELTSQFIVKILNIGCNLNYFLHDERLYSIITAHNNLKQHLRTILSHDNESLQIPDDIIDYCIMPYVNYNL